MQFSVENFLSEAQTEMRLNKNFYSILRASFWVGIRGPVYHRNKAQAQAQHDSKDKIFQENAEVPTVSTRP